MLLFDGLNVDSLPASRTATCFIPIVSSSQNPSFVIDVALAKKSYQPSLCNVRVCRAERTRRMGAQTRAFVVFVLKKKTPDFDRKKIKV